MHTAPVPHWSLCPRSLWALPGFHNTGPHRDAPSGQSKPKCTLTAPSLRGSGCNWEDLVCRSLRLQGRVTCRVKSPVRCVFKSRGSAQSGGISQYQFPPLDRYWRRLLHMLGGGAGGGELAAMIPWPRVCPLPLRSLEDRNVPNQAPNFRTCQPASTLASSPHLSPTVAAHLAGGSPSVQVPRARGKTGTAGPDIRNAGPDLGLCFRARETPSFLKEGGQCGLMSSASLCMCLGNVEGKCSFGCPPPDLLL